MAFPANLMQQFHHRIGSNATYKERYLIHDSLGIALVRQLAAIGCLLLSISIFYYRDPTASSYQYLPHLFALGFFIAAAFFQKKAIHYFHSYKHPGALFALEDKLFIIWDSSYEEHTIHHKDITLVEEIEENQFSYNFVYYSWTNKITGLKIEEEDGKVHKLLYRKMPRKISSELRYFLYNLDW